MTSTRTRRRRISKKQKRKRIIIRALRNTVIFAFVILSLCLGISLAKIISERNQPKECEVPLLLQTDERWKDKTYGNSTIEISGCGPTCLSMVAIALTGDESLTPDTVSEFSEENGYYVPGAGTSWTLMTKGADRLGLKAKELALDEKLIKSKLTSGHPIICCVGPGDFTTEGHFIVLTGYNDGMIHINDPNSAENSSRTWSYERLKTQISAMWFYS